MLGICWPITILVRLYRSLSESRRVGEPPVAFKVSAAHGYIRLTVSIQPRSKDPTLYTQQHDLLNSNNDGPRPAAALPRANHHNIVSMQLACSVFI